MTTATLTASIRRQGFSRTRRFIQHLKGQIRCELSHDGSLLYNAPLISDVVPAKPTGRANARPMTGSARAGTHSHRWLCDAKLERPSSLRLISVIGSLRSQGRRCHRDETV